MSLGSLASNHLRSSNPTGLSLGSLANNHLKGSGNLPALSLGSLAGSHLSSSNPPALGLASNPQAQPSPSLGLLAGAPLHVDLTTALRAAASVGDLASAAAPVSQTAPPSRPAATLLAPDLGSVRSGLSKRKATAFGRVVVRKWARLLPHSPLAIRLPDHGIVPFAFDSLSPDEAVMEAQSQSRAFARPAVPAN
jgi:hypothetical protein